ncbi:MAG: lysophospholipid acyltransferase family protein [Chloroflexi bacterium]|nr:lysophospholipid acyltransferase family protein [Chloroflexota bacterium]
MKNYLFLRFSSLVLRRLPVPIGYFIACVVADVVFFFSRRSKGAVMENLRRAVGTEDKQALRRVAREVFRNLARNYFDLLRLPYFSLPELEQGLSIHGWDHFQEAVAAGRGVILATAHLGNFDFMAQLGVARGYKMTVLVEPLTDHPQHRFMAQLRGSRGISFLPLGTASLKRVVRELRSGGVVVVACDRGVGKKGVRVRFLGEEAMLPSGAVELALMTGAALIPAFSVREGRRRFSLFIETPLPLAATGRDGHRVVENLERLLAVVGEYIRRYPGQWVTMEPVWSGRG